MAVPPITAPSSSHAASHAHSLRARLLLFLLAAVALIALAQGISAYRNALQQVDAMFDYQLQQMARSMGGGSGFVIGPSAGDVEQVPGDGDILVQIWGRDGVQVFRSPRSQLPLTAALLGFSDLRVEGRDYRVYTLQTPRQTIQLAQDLSERTARARALAVRAVFPIALLAPTLMFAVWWIVTRSLAPIERTRAQVAARAADDFSPLPDAKLPAEVQPLVAELNALFVRVRGAFDAQKNFVADAAHELRSPLTALKLQARALRPRDGASGDPLHEAALARLNQGIDRAIRLVEQLLALARAQAGTIESQGAGALASVDLGQVARLAASDVLTQAQTAGIELEVAGAAAESGGSTAPVVVRGDAESLRMLLVNLLDNAIKYTPAPGRVRLSLASAAGSAVLSVDDSGPGIAPTERDRVFDRFFRSPDASAGAAVGSGLGLAIVRAIAERHGTTIELHESTALGGLRACVKLPQPAPAAHAATPMRAAHAGVIADNEKANA
ncbi:MAG: ATP-binding protein [Burkholderiales bacterium]